jgi:polyisoprenoid-binding protein YceI
VVAIAVLAVAVPYVFIHFIEGPPPAKLSLPATTTTAPASTSGATSTVATSTSLAGTWKVQSGSVAGYRVNEVLVGQKTTAVGRTKEVWGSATLTSSSVSAAIVNVNLASVKSDQSMRNAQFDGRIMDVASYPIATLKLTSPINLGSSTALGDVTQRSVSGELTMHGVTKKVNFSVSVERTSSQLDVLAEIPVVFGEWNIANPSAGFVTTENNGVIEVLLYLGKGAGNAAHTSGATNSSGPGNPTITVPSTTVPTLRIGSGG